MNYSPIVENPPEKMNQYIPEEKKCGCVAFLWIVQIFIWGLLASGIIQYIYFNKNFTILIIFGMIYLVYLVIEFFISSLGNYLRNKNTEQGIYEKMGTLFQTPPDIILECECYHDSYEENVQARPDGSNVHEVSREITTYRESYKFPYYTARDVSGLFNLNLGKSNSQGIYYVQLELKEEINFADSITHYDYENEKAEFFKRNRYRDIFFRLRERKTIPGLKIYNLVKIGNKDPCMVNFFWFCFFNILTLGEFYRLYINSCCVNQRFTIKKLVSSRYDLNQPEYRDLAPKLDLISQQYQYEQDYYNYKNENYNLKIPTEEELEKSKQYKVKTPDYQISSCEDQFKQDIIIEKPEYSNNNPNETPVENNIINNSIAIGQDPISGTGAPPPNYEQEN